MKRTQHIDLDLMRKVANGKSSLLRPLALGLTVVTFSSCSNNTKEEAIVAGSPAECVAKTSMIYAECEAAYKQAEKEAERTGPKYQNKYECESEFGNGHCSQSQISGYFMPMMTGFLVGNMLSSDHSRKNSMYNPVYRYKHPYSEKEDEIMTADGTTIGSPGQRSYYVQKSALQPKPTVSKTIPRGRFKAGSLNAKPAGATQTVSRGGFGSTASSKSSWGFGRFGGWGG
ncbi:DUF1190 domain-containing protein [Desulfogranum japonicum]|uniref:DUF1190 domain-containing protein n=1 Tax=Desulfogranum japonicum TaxID=231447 RepID=UPI0004074F05|nr:DUF1190 domain-containing protein [Desulfogranum japonicum]